MSSLVLVVPGRLMTRTGGYGYDRRVIGGLADRGWRTSVLELDESFPHPTPTALEHAAQMFESIDPGRLVLVDGLALGAMPAVAEREATRLRLVALLHHPLAAETGIDPAVATALEASERRALAAVRHVIVTSPATAAALGRYRVPDGRITVVEPGTDRAPLARGRRVGPIALLAVAAVIPRKGFDVLCRALAALPHLEWRLTVVGSLDRDPETVSALRVLVREGHLESRIELAGEASEAELERHYDRADVFVLPTRHEGYGMAVAEALARGLPVISTPTGAIAELLADGAGVLVPADDVEALTVALERVISDEVLRRRLAEGARCVRERLPGWDVVAVRLASVLERV